MLCVQTVFSAPSHSNPFRLFDAQGAFGSIAKCRTITLYPAPKSGFCQGGSPNSHQNGASTLESLESNSCRGFKDYACYPPADHDEYQQSCHAAPRPLIFIANRYNWPSSRGSMHMRPGAPEQAPATADKVVQTDSEGPLCKIKTIRIRVFYQS